MRLGPADEGDGIGSGIRFHATANQRLQPTAAGAILSRRG
jgi:hypothetical protein